MPDANDVAKYLLETCGSMSTWRLQKLLYYSQAWSLVWDERPLFDNRIEAWANGPVVVDIYQQHKGQYSVDSWPKGDISALDKDARETIDLVRGHYKKYNTQQLSHLTHEEAPWRLARIGIPDGDRGDSEITHESMAEFYGSL